MEYFDIVGTVAALFTLLAVLPPVIAALRDKLTLAITQWSIAFSCAATLAWTFYGFILSSPELVITNLIIFVPLAILYSRKVGAT